MYVDYNATSPMAPAVREAVGEAVEHDWANPGSPHRLGQATAVKVQLARERVGKLMGKPAKEVFFTSGATEANAWVLHDPQLPVVASAVDHPSVLAWAKEVLAVDNRGVVCIEQLETRLRQGPALVSVMAANNETGVLQPVDEIARICDEYGSRFHCDATQMPGRMPVEIRADWVTISAHKMGGPRGVGALICKDPPTAILRGGGQERGHRAGTLNSPGIIGFGVAADLAGTMEPTARDQLEAYVRTRGAIVVGDGAKRLPNTLSALFSVPGDLIVAALDMRGIHASTGSACASGSSTTSHVLKAMGLDGTPVRFSFGKDGGADQIIPVLDDVLKEMEESCAW